MQSITEKFKSKPYHYYAFSIAATWAGAASLLVGIETAQEEGIVPFMLWAFGNTLACIVFGVLAPIIPHLRDVFASKGMKLVMGIMCPFQVWLTMSGIQSVVFTSTELPDGYGTVVAYTLAIIFVALLYWYGIIRNIITDNGSWWMVYVVAAILTVAVLVHSRGNMVALDLGLENWQLGLKKCVLLLPGPFLYPYFYTLLDYNEHNEDDTKPVNIRKAFIEGSLLFGAYLLFVFLMAWAQFSPMLSIIKAILITLVAVSTMSSMQLSMFTIFGRKIGLVLNVASIVAWQILVPLGVMGIWTLMSTIRIYIVLGGIVIALIWRLWEEWSE